MQQKQTTNLLSTAKTQNGKTLIETKGNQLDLRKCLWQQREQTIQNTKVQRTAYKHLSTGKTQAALNALWVSSQPITWLMQNDPAFSTNQLADIYRTKHLCGSRPLVTPYYCRLGHLLCFVFMSAYCMFDLSVYYVFLQYFDTVGWVFWPVKTVSHITYRYTVLVGT